MSDNGFEALHDQIAALRSEVLGAITSVERAVERTNGRLDQLADDLRALVREYHEHTHGAA